MTVDFVEGFGPTCALLQPETLPDPVKWTTLQPIGIWLMLNSSFESLEAEAPALGTMPIDKETTMTKAITRYIGTS
jgi:hypothetical protein